MLSKYRDVSGYVAVAVIDAVMDWTGTLEWQVNGARVSTRSARASAGRLRYVHVASSI